MGALGFQFVSADEANAWVRAYYNAFTKRQQKLADYQTNANIAVVSGFMCCETDEEAHVKAEGWTFFAFALRFYATHAPGTPGEINLWDEYQKFRATDAGKKMHAGGLVGSPETIRNRLRKFEGVTRRPGDPAQPGRQEHAPGHLRLARAVREGGHAGVPRAGRRAPGRGSRPSSPATSSSTRSTRRPRRCHVRTGSSRSRHPRRRVERSRRSRPATA